MNGPGRAEEGTSNKLEFKLEKVIAFGIQKRAGKVRKGPCTQW